jgi:2-succinyl-5-enolpyruvyl-6-hydroxy-3-cyclohexene-1-carboxylate synthase
MEIGVESGPSPLITRYKSLVRNPAAARALRPDWVLRFGRAPISRTVLEWLPGIPLILVDPVDRWPDPAHDLALDRSMHLDLDPVTLCEALTADPPYPADPAWLASWTAAEARLGVLTADYLTAAPWCEAHLIVDLVARLPAGEGLLCANSLPIRQFETWSGTREAPLTVFGNRGLSGIDGQLSTLAGLQAAGRPTTGLLGDLSFLHDLSGLMLAARLDRPCIVINNGGGRIFDYLPQRGLPDYERLWRTPRPIDLGALAGTFGLHHRRVSEAPDWRSALTDGLAGVPGMIIEVMIDATQSQEVHLQFRQRVAVADLLAG